MRNSIGCYSAGVGIAAMIDNAGNLWEDAIARLQPNLKLKNNELVNSGSAMHASHYKVQNMVSRTKSNDSTLLNLKVKKNPTPGQA